MVIAQSFNLSASLYGRNEFEISVHSVYWNIFMFDNLQGPYVEQPNATVASTVRALVVTIFEQTCFAY